MVVANMSQFGFYIHISKKLQFPDNFSDITEHLNFELRMIFNLHKVRKKY
jgi:hypothetical protein